MPRTAPADLPTQLGLEGIRPGSQTHHPVTAVSSSSSGSSSGNSSPASTTSPSDSGSTSSRRSSRASPRDHGPPDAGEKQGFDSLENGPKLSYFPLSYFYLANKSIKFILAHAHAPCFNAQFEIALHIAKQIFKHMPFATKKIHTIFQKI